MPSEYDQSEPDYSTGGAQPSTAAVVEHPIFAKAPFVDLRDGQQLTMARLLGLVANRGKVEAAKAKLRGRTNAVRGWRVHLR